MPLGPAAEAVYLNGGACTPFGPRPADLRICGVREGPLSSPASGWGWRWWSGSLVADLTYGVVTYGFVAYDAVGSGLPLVRPLEYP